MAPTAATLDWLDQPGVWIGPPPETDRRHDRLRRVARGAVTALLAILVLAFVLVSIGPKFLPYQTYFVRSGSMEPAIGTGELIVLTKADAADIEVGDVITFDRPDKPGTKVTHRVVGIETNEVGRYFVTKGDANGSPDSWRVPANGTGWKHAFGIPKLGFVVGYLGTNEARLALLAVPAVALGVLSLVDIWRPSGSKQQSRRRR